MNKKRRGKTNSEWAIFFFVPLSPFPIRTPGSHMTKQENLLTPCSSSPALAPSQSLVFSPWVSESEWVWVSVSFIAAIPKQRGNMADTDSEVRQMHTDFEELEDAEDLFPEPAATQEVSLMMMMRRSRRRMKRRPKGAASGRAWCFQLSAVKDSRETGGAMCLFYSPSKQLLE